ncbi:MAG: hypothetical protein V9E94_01160 [Microthrixaceae bacterium]
MFERVQHRAAPRAVIGGVVDLVEHDEGAPAPAAPGRRRDVDDLLVGGHDAVHVGRESTVARGPLGVQVQAEAGRCFGPLVLQVLGRGDDDHSAPGGLAQVLNRGGEREGRLAGAGSRDRQEVGPVLERQGVERLRLPRPQPDAGRAQGCGAG